MSISNHFYKWVVGPGLLRLQPKVPLLVQRWLIVRGLEIVRGSIIKKDHYCESDDLKSVLRDQGSADWQDDVTSTLMALLLLCGIAVAYTPLTQLSAPQSSLNDFSFAWIGPFVVIQATLLVLTALAWRFIAAAPAFFYFAALLVFGCWSYAVYTVAPQLHFFLLMPMMLGTLAWLLKLEITRALRAPGASVLGALAVLGIFLLAIYAVLMGGYIRGILISFFSLLAFMDERTSRQTDANIMFLFVLFGVLATTVWSKKIILSWCANDRNPPIICSSAASWTFLMDIATFGIFGLYLQPKSEAEAATPSSPGNAPAADAKKSSPSAPPEHPSWSIGENVNNPQKRPKS